MIGYFAQWAIYSRDYNVLDVEADKLTHLLYAFYNPVYDSANDSGSIQTLDAWADTGHNESGLLTTAAVKGNIGELKILKDRNPHLKIMISVGGWTKSQDFPAIASSQNARQTFAQSLVNFMTLYPWIVVFDLDWEFPVTGGTGGQEKVIGLVIPVQPHTTNDHKNLVFLLKQMRETFDSNGMQSKEISIAMGTNFVPLVNTSKHYEDSASPFFFGDEVNFSNDQARFDYFSQNKHQDSKLISNPNNKHVTFGNHFSELNATGVKLVLMGAGVGDSPDGIGDATYPGATLTDDHFWIQKVQDYYINHLITSTLGFESSTISDLSSDFTVLIENQQLVIKNISDSLKNTDVYLFDFTGKLLMDMPNQQIGIRETIRLSQTLLSNTFYVCLLKTEGSVGAFKIISK